MGAIRAVSGAVLLVLASAADASFHRMLIREVYAGSAGAPAAQYVMLQLRQANQNQLTGHTIKTYTPAGTLINTYTFGSAVASGSSQAYVLIATQEAVDRFGVAADLVMANADLDPAGGMVCYDTVDCFTWGNYSGSTTSPSPTGTPFSTADGLAGGRAARRDITPGTSTLLDSLDDTNDCAADFDATTPVPRNNAGQAAVSEPLGSGVQFADFSATAGLNLGGGAAAGAGVLRLTPAEADPAATYAWHELRQNVFDGFETQFDFRITPGGGFGVEGFAFVVQNQASAATGDAGGGLGYQGVANSVVVEFDTNYNDAAEIGVADPYPGADAGDPAEPAENHVAIHTLGVSANSASADASLGTSQPLPQLDDGSVHSARIVYIPGSLQAYVDDMEVPVASAAVDLGPLIDLYGGAAFAGFTAATAVPGSQEHDLLNWQLGPAVVDATPRAFAFDDVVDAATGSNVTSNPIVVGGINTPVAIGIAGPSSATYAVNDGLFTRDPGTVRGGDSVRVKVQASPNTLSARQVTLTIGGVADIWTVTTGAADTTPNVFTFTDAVDQATGTVVRSNTLSISGINAPAAISISGGTAPEYRINGGGFTSAAGTIANGDSVQVRHRTAITTSTTSTTQLRIGSGVDSWSTTTGTIDTSPDPFKFPAKGGQLQGVLVTSAPLVLTGFSSPSTIVVSAGFPGEYSLDGAAFTSANGVVEPGATIQVRHTSATAPASYAETRVTIGGVTGRFVSKTK